MILTVLHILAIWLAVGVALTAAAFLGDLARGDAADFGYLRIHWKGVACMVVAWPYALWVLCSVSEDDL